MTDITLLTDRRYDQPEQLTSYIANILTEATLLREALEALGMRVERTHWDNPNYDFSQTRAVVFRTVWDYFERFNEFMPWLKRLNGQTQLINPLELIEWNCDKHYLLDLQQKGFPIVPTQIVKKGQRQRLGDVCQEQSWEAVVIKPAISGAGFETYKILPGELEAGEIRFSKLLTERDMLVQPFVESIPSKGEASLMVFGGTYTHAILKKARPGDFRVQDDFGGTVHPFTPAQEEIALAEAVFKQIRPLPAYGRLDIVWDEDGKALISELEIIEPELWLREHPPAAEIFARAIRDSLA